MEKPDFDLEKVYDEQINPLMDKIIAICKEHNLPFAASFQYNSEGEVCSSAFLPKERSVCTALKKIYAVLVPPSSPMLKITTKDADGKIKSIDLIQGV